MPKAKLNKSSTSFMTYGHPLSEVAQKTLIEILGFGTVDLQAEAPPIVFVWRECGESEAAAIQRAGVKPGQDVVFISWQDAALV